MLNMEVLSPRLRLAIAVREHLGFEDGDTAMSKGGATAIAFALALTCAGCGSWSGFGFDASGPEMPRLRQVLALKEGMVLADVGAGKGQLTLALAREVGSSGRSSRPKSTRHV